MKKIHVEKVVSVQFDDESESYQIVDGGSWLDGFTDRQCAALTGRFSNSGKSYSYVGGFRVPGEVMSVSPHLGSVFGEVTDSVVTAELRGDGTAVIRVIELGMKSSMVVWMLVSGTGTDGGFGDYSPPVYGDPLSFEGEYIWFTDRDSARRVAEVLSYRSSSAFYDTGFHDQYDGRFPAEYQAVMIPQVSGSVGISPWSVKGAVNAVTAMDEDSW